MKKKRIIFAFMAVLVAAGALVFVFRFSNTRLRAEHEHGMSLPASAQGIQCRGDAWRCFFDRGASTTFTMDISELPAFLGTLRPDTNLWTFIPGNAEYHGFPKEWQNAKPDARFSCRSSVADFLEVRIFRMDTKRVGVWMYTDWN